MGLAREASQNMNPPPVLVHDSGERDLSDQLLETWMLLEYCDQGNLESAAREARFQRDYVSAPSKLVWNSWTMWHRVCCPSWAPLPWGFGPLSPSGQKHCELQLTESIMIAALPGSSPQAHHGA